MAQADLPVRFTARIMGDVQGVGFRYLTARQARDLGLDGMARNLADGSVEVVAQGPRADLEELLAWLDSTGAPGRVADIRVEWSAAVGTLSGFRTA